VFQSVINDAKSAAASFVDKYLARASVAIPFVVAFGFATAAASLALTERFGATSAFWIMAAGFCTIGLLAAMVVTMKEQETAAAEEQQSDEGELGEIASAAATQAAGQLPLALLASLLGSPAASAQTAARLIARNMPLVLLLALVALLFWPTEETTGGHPIDEEDCATDKPDELKPTAPDDPLREAA